VEFEPDCRVGYVGLAAMERELSAVLGRKVDLRTPDELSRYFREDVLRAARVAYPVGLTPSTSGAAIIVMAK